MLIFDYDRNTGELLGQREARTNPLNEEEYLIPGFATTEIPYVAKSGFAIVFLNETWQYVEDYRGQIVYDKETGKQSTIAILGPIAENFTSIPYPGSMYTWVNDTWKLNPLKEVDTEINDAKLRLAAADAQTIKHLRSIIIALVEGQVPVKEDVDVIKVYEEQVTLENNKILIAEEKLKPIIEPIVEDPPIIIEEPIVPPVEDPIPPVEEPIVLPQEEPPISPIEEPPIEEPPIEPIIPPVEELPIEPVKEEPPLEEPIVEETTKP